MIRKQLLQQAQKCKMNMTEADLQRKNQEDAPDVILQTKDAVPSSTTLFCCLQEVHNAEMEGQ